MNYSFIAELTKHPSLRLVPTYRRMFLPITLVVLLMQTQTHQITVRVLSDAFWQVAVFVAMTLTLYHFFVQKMSRFYQQDNCDNKSIKEIVIASFMGVLPGCGGAIVVMTQYVGGKMSFGAVVAVLTSTMGDAAFLLLAAEPVTGLGMVALCFVVGISSGVIVNKMHGADFLRHTTKINAKNENINTAKTVIPLCVKYQGSLWQWLMIPGSIIGLLMAGQVNVAAFFGINDNVMLMLGASITLVFILLWALTQEVDSYQSIVSEDKKTKQNKVFQKIALDTNFVTSWVVVAFLSFELIILYGNFDLTGLFKDIGAIAPLMGVVIGMIPGCGPQIVTTSLYLSGAIPLSAQIGNAISNDGDALFPAIALSPKVALVATLYSSVPALIVAYGYFWLFEY